MEKTVQHISLCAHVIVGGNVAMASRACLSFLLFLPDDDAMLKNKDYYDTLLQASEHSSPLPLQVHASLKTNIQYCPSCVFAYFKAPPATDSATCSHCVMSCMM